MTDAAPKRIWATEDRENHGEDAFHSTRPFSGGVEYILASEHAALIREAEARGRWLGLKDARDIANLNAWKHVGDDPYSRGMDEGARHQSRVIHVALSEEIMRTSSSTSAAIRAAKATP